jgi:hypothetical protein
MTREPAKITITFRPLSSAVPAAPRLKRLLKFALRACSMRCLTLKVE